MKIMMSKLVFVIAAMNIVCSTAVLAAKPKPDISSDGLKLGNIMLADGVSRTVNAKAADFHANGRCMFEASYITNNTGPGSATVKFVNILKRNGKLVRRNPVDQLKSKSRKEHKFLLSLESGENHLELMLDSSDKVDEAQEKNNRISAVLKINGRCSGKQRVAGKNSQKK